MPSRRMPPIVHRATTHVEALAWDIEQHLAMSPEERQRAARALKRRVWPGPNKDVRECRPAE
jgi:hypothetical protein